VNQGAALTREDTLPVDRWTAAAGVPGNVADVRV